MSSSSPRPRIVISHRVHAEVFDRLRQHGDIFANETDRAWPAEELARRLRDADALMAFMPDHVQESTLRHCTRLRVIAGAFKGHDNIDLEACGRHGIWVCNVPDLLTEPTAELAVGLLLGLIRNVLPGDRHARGGAFRGWQPILYGSTLNGAAVGIVGMGEVGRAIARRLRGFNCDLLYYDPQPLSVAHEIALNACFRDLDVLLNESDALILAAPLTAFSRNLLAEPSLRRLRRGSYMVNVGRGSVIDEQAVARLIADGHLAGYAADVFAMEDLSVDDRPDRPPEGLLKDTQHTLLTPHLGSAVGSIRKQIELSAAQSIIEALTGRPPRHAVNRVIAPPREGQASATG